MKGIPWVAGILFAIAASASIADAQASQGLRLRVENPSSVERPEEVVSVPWSALGGAAVRGGGAPRVTDAMGADVMTQVMDADRDGRPDSLLFIAALPPAGVRDYFVTAGQGPAFAPRVALRHDVPRDDMAWENDRVAFRMYGEGLKQTPWAMSSSGIDAWQKRTRDLILERWYAKGSDSYHTDVGEGADFFDVGTTLGVGGTALWIADTIHRADNFRAIRVIAVGPIRAIFELDYAPWGPPGREVTETKRIIIDAGQHLYRQESLFRSDGSADIIYVTGVVKRAGMTATMSRDQPWAWLTGWGAVAMKNGGHGELGTAVMLPRARLDDWKEAHGHYLALSRATPGIPVVHYIGSAWTASGDFPTPQTWWRHLDLVAQRLAAPARVTVIAPPQ